MTRRRVLLAVAALAFAAGCARVDRLLESAPEPTPEEGAWAQQRERWTRKASIYDGFAMRALATGTYQAPEVRRARAERLAAWKGMAAPEREALLAQEEAELASFDDFVLAITTADAADNDLDARSTAWRVALVFPGAPDVLATDIVELRPDAQLRTLYPHISDFDLVYRIRFPRTAGSETWKKTFTMRIAGPRGRLEFPFGGAEGSTGAAVSPAE